MALGLGVSACGHPVERRLEGHWQGDSVENVPSEQLAAATGWVRGTRFDFAAGKMKVTIPAEEPREGRFEVASVREHKVRLEVKRPDGTSDPVDLQMDDEYSLRWNIGEGRTVVLRRAN